MDLWGRLAGIAISKRYALGTRSANYATALPSTLTNKPLLLASLAPEALKKEMSLLGKEISARLRGRDLPAHDERGWRRVVTWRAAWRMKLPARP